MYKLDNNFTKVIKFYQSLPNELINDILNNILITNRQKRRHTGRQPHNRRNQTDKQNAAQQVSKEISYSFHHIPPITFHRSKTKLFSTLIKICFYNI